jgi:hypothetical protein
LYDKREDLKAKTLKREAQMALKNYWWRKVTPSINLFRNDKKYQRMPHQF